MVEFLMRYIDALIPLAAGVVVCFFPQVLTKKDLTLPENEGTARKLKWAGCLLLLAGVLLGLASAFK